MSKMEFKPATRRQLKVKVGLMGTAGTGKTWNGMVIAEALAGPTGRFCVIDSERGRAEAYAGEFAFDHLPLPNYSPETYIEALGTANDGGYDVILVDGVSHEWMGRDGVLASVDRFGGWKDATPRHDAFVETLFRLPRHVICTIRAKTQYQVEEVMRDGRMKQEITKLGVGPVQRDNLEYEFDLLGMVELDHSIRLHKSVIWSLPSGSLLDPGENPKQLGREIALAVTEWVNTGEPVETPTEAAPKEVAYLVSLLQAEGFDDSVIDAQFKKRRLELGALTPTYVADQQTLAEERLAAKSVDIATIQAAYGRTSASDAPEGEAATTEPSDASPGAEAPEIAQAETGTDGEQQTLDTPDKPASSRPKRTSREGNTAQEGSA